MIARGIRDPLPAKRGAITRLVKAGKHVAAVAPCEKAPQEFVDNRSFHTEEPEPVVDNQSSASSRSTPGGNAKRVAVKGKKAQTFTPLPPEQLKTTRHCVVSRAYKFARRQALANAATDEVAKKAAPELTTWLVLSTTRQ